MTYIWPSNAKWLPSTIEAIFMHVSYNIINVIILFNGNLKIRLRYTTD